MNQPSLQSISTPTSLMLALRNGTAQAHRDLETRIDTEKQLVDLDRYGRLLQYFHGIYAPLEQQLSFNFPQGVAGIDIAARGKSAWLEKDLEALHLPVPRTQITQLPPLATEAQALGCMYVLEGSTLGGQMIVRMVATQLGLTPETGARFYHGYGPETGAHWKSFAAAAEAAALAPEEVIASARATFDAFAHWADAHAIFRD